jgi:flavin-dependent dehydrogenase
LAAQMDDIAIAGAGPAGAFAAAILATAGLRVSVFDRARFPRHKLCGDTLNPGALAVIGRHADVTSLVDSSDPIDGMLLTGPGGVRVRGEYGGGVAGRSITRKVLDQWLIDRAVEAGATLHEEAIVRDVAITDGRVAGLITSGRDGHALKHQARMVIAADGRGAGRRDRARGVRRDAADRSRPSRARHPPPRRVSIEVAIQSRVAIAGVVAVERDGRRRHGEGAAVSVRPHD